MSLSPQIYPPSTQIDVPDSHYQYVLGRVQAVNSSRVFGGIVEARDWPFQKAQPEAFYMTIDRSKPVRMVNSWHSPLYTFDLQWVWLIIGTDVQSTNEQANRGDRYRTDYVMQQELIKGLWPGFCEKQTYTIGPDPVTNTPKLTAVAYSPEETLWWGKPLFSTKIDRSTGILFSYGQVQVSSFAPVIDS